MRWLIKFVKQCTFLDTPSMYGSFVHFLGIFMKLRTFMILLLQSLLMVSWSDKRRRQLELIREFIWTFIPLHLFYQIYLSFDSHWVQKLLWPRHHLIGRALLVIGLWGSGPIPCGLVAPLGCQYHFQYVLYVYVYKCVFLFREITTSVAKD